MIQFSDEDKKTTNDFLGLLVNLGLSPTQAYEQVNSILKPLGWEFMYFNDIEDFWITTNEMK